MVEAVDELAGVIGEEIVIQSGNTQYAFKHARAIPFLEHEEMERLLREASVVILQGGWGTIAEALALGKRVISIPRRVGTEHNHPQEEVVRELEKMGCLIGCYEEKDLPALYEKALTFHPLPLKKGEAAGTINAYIDALPAKEPKKIYCISSHGGHLHELTCAVSGVKGAFSWCTHKTKATKASFAGRKHHFILDPGTNKFKFLVNAIQAFWYLIQERPDIVISTGAGIAIPTMLLAKLLFRSKLIFIESAANVVAPSKTGRFMYKYADLFLTQWEGLSGCFPKAVFVGVL